MGEEIQAEPEALPQRQISPAALPSPPLAAQGGTAVDIEPLTPYQQLLNLRQPKATTLTLEGGRARKPALNEGTETYPPAQKFVIHDKAGVLKHKQEGMRYVVHRLDGSEGKNPQSIGFATHIDDWDAPRQEGVDFGNIREGVLLRHLEQDELDLEIEEEEPEGHGGPGMGAEDY